MLSMGELATQGQTGRAGPQGSGSQCHHVSNEEGPREDVLKDRNVLKYVLNVVLIITKYALITEIFLNKEKHEEENS